MTNYTPNFDLPEYEPTDLPALTDQYNEAMGKVDTALQGLKDKDTETANLIAGINRELTEHAEDITNAQADIASLQKTDGEHTAEITALQSSVAGAAQAAAKAQETADANTTAIAAVKAHDDSQDAQIAANTAEISEVKATADDALATATENQGDIMKAESDITALTGRVSKNETDIAGIQLDTEQVDKNTAAIAEQAKSINSLDLLNWSVREVKSIDFATPGTTGNGSIFVFENSEKTLFKIAGQISKRSGQNYFTNIPGSEGSNYTQGWNTGVQLDDLGVFRFYVCAGITHIFSNTVNKETAACHLAIGTDNNLYVVPVYQDQTQYTFLMTLIQTPLTLHNYNLNPDDPDATPESYIDVAAYRTVPSEMAEMVLNA